MKELLGSATCVLYILVKGDHNFLFSYFFYFLLLISFYAVNGMPFFSFCRKSTVYYNLLLNLVKQI